MRRRSTIEPETLSDPVGIETETEARAWAAAHTDPELRADAERCVRAAMLPSTFDPELLRASVEIERLGHRWGVVVMRSGLNREVIPSPNGVRRRARSQDVARMWLRPLPDSLDRDSITRWRASHTEGQVERYRAAHDVARAILAAPEADRVAVAAEVFAAASAALAKVETKRPRSATVAE